jgi:NAD(P)-dependent dehydrogenase (short-subunit alcohol dehydrogenase family)
MPVIKPISDLDGKVAFVTGGASGIGLGIVQVFLEAGMRVVIADSSREHIDQAMMILDQMHDRAYPMVVDVTHRPGVESAAAEVVDAFGRIHVLVNNAGIQNSAPLCETSYEEWDRVMAVNVDGIFNCIRVFLPRIKHHGEGGHILTTASMHGLFTGGGGYSAYCASKFAAVAMMETLRAHLAASNIGVSILCPGPVRSNLEQFTREFEFALDPVDVGRRVLRGMRNNDLYILTHPEFNIFIQCRTEAILASTPTDLHPTGAMKAIAQAALPGSIYVAERRRHRPELTSAISP